MRGVQNNMRPDFLLSNWVPSGYDARHSNYCFLEPTDAYRAKVDQGLIQQIAGFRDCDPKETVPPPPPPPTRETLERAKTKARSFSIVIMAEEFATGLQQFVKGLGWPSAETRKNRWHAPPAVERAALDARAGRRLTPRVPHHDMIAALEHMAMAPATFAKIADATQASTEFYFFLRELTRGFHANLDLPPPDLGLAPPGELADLVF